METVRLFTIHSKIKNKKESYLLAFKSKKYTKLTQQVLNELEEYFNKNHYPSKELLEELAQKYNQAYARIKNWFRTQRKKMFDVGALNYEVIKF